jgi:hypothetical protein
MAGNRTSASVRPVLRQDDDLAHHGRMRTAGVRHLSRLLELDDVGTAGHELTRVEGAVDSHSAVFDVGAIRPAHTIAGFDGEVAWLKTLRALKGNLDLVNRGTLLGRHSTAARYQ